MWFTTTTGCDKIRQGITRAEGALPFVPNYNDRSSPFLKVVDSFPLKLIWSRDTRLGGDMADAASVGKYVENIVGSSLGANAIPKLDDAVVCYAAGIPLARLLVLHRAARNFSTFMVVDAAGRVVAQIGSEPLPITSLDGLAPATLAASLGRPTVADTRGQKLADSLEPVDLTVGGREFVAYVRPFSPPPSFDACKLKDKPAVQPGSVVVGGSIVEGEASPSPTAGDNAAEPVRTECLVVALMPRATIWRQVLALPLTIGAALGLAIGGVIALLPSLRLILLGPGESIGRAEAIGVALGIPAAVSLATLALLFTADLAVHRQAARTLAKSIAVSAAKQAAYQIAEATDLMAASTASPSLASFPTGRERQVSSFYPQPEACDKSGADPSLAVDPAPVCATRDFCQLWPQSGLPLIDTIGLMDEDGEQVAGSVVGACRGYAGGRANVSARDYFVRLRAGASSPDGATRAAGERRARPYVLQHVVALQDGIAKSIIGMEAPAPLDYRLRQSERGRVYVTGGATLTSLIAPVLPSPFGLMIVDTRADTLPVLLDPTPGRSGAEKLATMIRNGSQVRDSLRALLVASGPAEPAYFRAFYDGADQAFVAAPIAGSRWVAIAHYSIPDIDRQPARTVVKAAQSWATFSIVFTVSWVVWLAWKRRRGWPRLWPQHTGEGDYRALTLGFTGLAAAGLLAGSVISPPAALTCGLLVRLGAAVWLHWRLRVKPAMGGVSGKLRPATQRSYTRMAAALIVCLSVVPMIGFWREARQFTYDEARRAELAQFTAIDGALESNRRIFDRLRWAYGIDAAPSEPRAMPKTARIEAVPGAYGVVVKQVARVEGADDSGFRAFFSRFLTSWLGLPPTAPVAHCTGKPPSKPVLLCEDGTNVGIDIVAPPLLTGHPEAAAVAALLAFAAGLVALFYWVLTRVLRSLAGFGVPLEAVSYPHLFLGDL